jgi:hypothetical protein
MLSTRSGTVSRRSRTSGGPAATGAVAAYLEALERDALQRARTWSGSQGGHASVDVDDDDLDRLELDFVLHAKAYAHEHGIEYATWREFGVPAGVLARAGIARAR